jgi:hypothetical protein
VMSSSGRSFKSCTHVLFGTNKQPTRGGRRGVPHRKALRFRFRFHQSPAARTI